MAIGSEMALPSFLTRDLAWTKPSRGGTHASFESIREDGSAHLVGWRSGMEGVFPIMTSLFGLPFRCLEICNFRPALLGLFKG